MQFSVNDCTVLYMLVRVLVIRRAKVEINLLERTRYNLNFGVMCRYMYSTKSIFIAYLSYPQSIVIKCAAFLASRVA